ncbi:MAG: DUF5348 domain-containing protein [Candidatus Onthomonas sp.]
MLGILIQNGDRPDIVFEDGTLYGGLHCGACFQILNEQWCNVRLEYAEDWILICDSRKIPLKYGYTVSLK